MFGNGALSTTLSVHVGEPGAPVWIIGAVTAQCKAGIVVDTKFDHEMIANVGYIRAF